MRLSGCVLGLLVPLTATQPTPANVPGPTTDAPTTAAPVTAAPTSAAPVTQTPTSVPTGSPVVAPGLFGPIISVEYGRPAWSNPTLPASAACPYSANSVGGGRTGVDLFEYLLDTEGAIVQVQPADTWATIAARVTAAGLCNSTMDPQVSTADILRYRMLNCSYPQTIRKAPINVIPHIFSQLQQFARTRGNLGTATTRNVGDWLWR